MTKERETGEGGSRLAAAMAVGQAGERADTFLDEQTKLTRLQIEQIEEENATRRRILKLEHASAAMKFAFELALAVIFTTVAIGLGWAVWGAMNDRGLVVESFSVPPDLAGRGLTGEVIAARLLDKLSYLQSATASSRAASSYANNWGNDIKLQIPDTGVSIGEFNRSLHAWLGRQTRITGEIYRMGNGGIAVTARAGSNSGPTFTGSDADLDRLLRKAAESVYGATQPYRYAVFLNTAGRTKEAEAAYLALIANGSPTDRAWAHIGIENIYANRGENARALAMLHRALALKPGFIMAYINETGIEGQLQHDEAALAAQEKAAAIARGPRDPDMSEMAWTIGGLQVESGLAAELSDYKAQLGFDHEIEALPDFNNAGDNSRLNDVTTYALLHDEAASEAAFDALPSASGDLAFLQRSATHVLAQFFLGHPDLILALRQKLDASLMKLGPGGIVIAKRQFWPFVASAMAMKGDFMGAHALIDRTPVDCSQCMRARGTIDALEKNWAGANYWFARAAKDAPTPPAAWSDWGRMLLQKGDYDGAITKLSLAHDKGPHFADALEYWGEALAKKGRSDLALAKFEEANRYAPNWGRLHLKWGEALLWSGDKAGAARQFAVATSLDLAPSERAELARAGAHG
jgi:tetratricopeptide (TPR) repeat protein